MDLSALVTKLGNVSELGQVVEASPGGWQTPVDTAAELYSLLGSLVGNRVFPLTEDEIDAALPNIVYQQVSSQAGFVEGYRVTQTDGYVLMVRVARTGTYAALLTLLGQINTALAGSTYSIQIEDVLLDYDDQQETYRANLDVRVTYLSAGAQTMPAAFVYPVNRFAGPEQFDNFVGQRVTNEYGIVLVTADGDLQTLMDAVQAELLGWQRVSAGDPFTYVSGKNLEGVAGLEVWREVYADSDYIRQA